MRASERGGAVRVLVVEDDAGLRRVIEYNLREEGWQIVAVARGDEALRRLQAPDAAFDLVVTDVRLPGADGHTILEWVRDHMPGVPVVLVTAFGTVDEAAAALTKGAADYVTKPFRRTEFLARVRRALDVGAVERENRALRERVSRAGEPRIVTASPAMQEVLRVVDRVAPSDVTVLITGESGTGKELVARRLHARSQRAAGPFVPVNCAALPRDLLESELFGYVRGAFTGAARDRKGRFELAHGGTLFLDEIGELPLELQAKILRVIEEGVVDPIGSDRRRPVDVRIVAATHRDLAQQVDEGQFRLDLYHRLSVVPIRLPALRERPEDVPLLVRHFLDQLVPNERIGVAERLMEELAQRPWPGNVRELRNTVERMVLLRRGDVLDLADLAEPGGHHAGQVSPAQDMAAPARGAPPARGNVLNPGTLELPDEPFSLVDLEREIIVKALERHGGNRSATARYLGIPRHVLLYRLEKYGIDSAGRSPSGGPH